MNNQQQRNTSNPLTWLILVIVVIALGVGAYFLFFQEDGMNTNNINTTVNTNITTNKNVNTVSNTNTDANINSTTNANIATSTNVDTSGWETYSNDEWKYSFKHPSDSQVQDYSSYNSGVYALDLQDDKIVPQPGGAIPISVQVFNNSVQEVKSAVAEKDSSVISWSETTLSDVSGEYSEADHGGAASEYYYVFSLTNATILIKTTDPAYILPTFQFN